MTITEYFKCPRLLTKRELREIDDEIELISQRVEELNDDNSDDSTLLDHYSGRLDALELILERSERLARIRESGFKVVVGGAA